MATLSTWSDRHLTTCRATLAPGTIKQYTRAERDFLAWVRSDDPAALSLANARAWLTELRDPHRGLQPATVKLYGTCLKVWANWLEQEEEVADNPLRKLKLPRVHKPVIEIFSPEQVHALALVAREGPHPERDVALLYFALDTMARSNELRTAVIPDALRGSSPAADAGWMTIRGKGSKDRRLHYEAATAAHLLRYLRTRSDRHQWLFLTDRGQQFGEFAFLRIIQDLGARANIRGVRCSPHTLRHSGAVRFLQAYPEHLAQLKLRLGHETLDMTLRYATRATEESILSDNGTSALDLLGLTKEENA